MDHTRWSRREIIGAAGLLAGSMVVSPLFARSVGKFEVAKPSAEWRKQLGSKRYAVLREGATERPGSSPLNSEKRPGAYVCAGCDLTLFRSETKFDSGTGWPSFFKAVPGSILQRKDTSLGMIRTEVLCRRCGGHLGHLFKDGPKPTGLRYCINGLALRFKSA